VPENRAVVLGGDLNMREADLTATGGGGGTGPTGLDDLWFLGGCREECRYNWDLTRNTNKEVSGRFKPRARFDRIYLRDSNPSRVRVKYFGLSGLEKVPGTQSFPSDHWAIEATLRIKSR